MIEQEYHKAMKEISEKTVNKCNENGDTPLITLINHIGIEPIKETLIHADMLIKNGALWSIKNAHSLTAPQVLK